MIETVLVTHVALSLSCTSNTEKEFSWMMQGVSWPFITDSLPAVEEEAAEAGGGAPVELVREEEELSPTWVGLDSVLAAMASLC